MKIGAKTDIGKVRERNEDAFGYHDNLFVLADGMGGHRAGEIASTIAVETILQMKLDSKDIISALQKAVENANQAIMDEVQRNPEHFGMGTTVAVLYFDENYAYVTHIGDSRVYLYSKHQLTQLTNDHSLVAELIRNGKLTVDEAKNHPQRNILTRALGTELKIELEVFQIPVVVGEKFLLCSDGLTGILDEIQIKDAISSNDEPQIIVNSLISMAYDCGGPDNITVILIEI